MNTTCKSLRLAEVISALSYSLDLTEGQPLGHCVRCCWLGTRLAMAMNYEPATLADIYYTILLKDAGCSSNAERIVQLYRYDDRQLKKDFKTVDTDNLAQVTEFALSHSAQDATLSAKLGSEIDLSAHSEELFTTRCERGAEIATEMGFNRAVAEGIRYLDEHWNGQGQPYQKAGKEIPVASQIALLSQVVDVFHQVGGSSQAVAELRNRRGTWFSEELVDAFIELATNPALWEVLESPEVDKAVVDLEPIAACIEVDEERLDRIANSFAQVVDAKSHFTYGHSSRVAYYTTTIARALGYSRDKVRWLNRGALLHDLGKLGVSNTILDKPDKLNDSEWHRIRKHPEMGEQILQRISAFADVAFVAGQHHERLDGKGYPLGLTGEQLSLDVRIVTVADVFDAISAERPYRAAMSVEKTMDIMWKNVDSAFDRRCLQALGDTLEELAPTVAQAQL